MPTGRYVTPDEPVWVYRAVRFADALAARDWTAVPPTGHPGVTTMWLGAAGIAIRRLLDPAGSAAHLEWIRRMAWLAPENGEAFRHLASFLPWSRAAVALVTTLGLAVLYPLLKRRFDRRVALLATGLLALDPFLIGHSGLLHTDALVSTFSLLALATALCGMQEPRRAVWPILSGIFTGLALLTKIPALILIPCILLLQVIAAIARKPLSPNPQSPIVRLSAHKVSNLHLGHLSFVIFHWTLFLLPALLTCLALYPPLRSDPSTTLQTLFTFAESHVEMAQRPIFFGGQATYAPGPAFYPAAFIFRVSPVVLVGLLIGLATLRRQPSDRRFVFLLSVAFAVGFGVAMSLGAKKHDRYLLPAFPPLTLAAALALETVSRRQTSSRAVRPSSTHPSSTRSSLACILALLVQSLLALAFAFYPLTYANPLAGGPWVAARVLAVDWGEGVGAAARWLNRLPDAEGLTVAATSVPSFASIFYGRTLPLDQATLADSVVLGASQSANQPAGELADRLRSQSAQTFTLGQIEHASVYTNAAALDQAAYLAAHTGTEDLILLDADGPLLRHYTGPGDILSVADLPDRSTIAAHLRQLSAGRPSLWLVANPAAAPITAVHLRQELEAIATPAHTTTVASATITQFSNPKSQTPDSKPRVANFGEYLALIDALLPGTPVNTPFPVYLRWQVSAPTPTNLSASLALQDAAGHLWAEVGQLVLNDVYFPTTAWQPGEWADNRLKPKLHKRIPPGTYAVMLTVTDAAGEQLGAWDAGGQFQGVRVPLGDVEIAPPTEHAGPAPCAAGRSLAADPFVICLPEIAQQTIPSGDALALALTWSATAAPKADYHVRWRLLDPAGSVTLEQVTALSPYNTSRWREGDSFEARYDLRLDPAAPAGHYRLALNVLTPGSRPLLAEDEILVPVEITPRDRSFELPAGIAHPLEVALGSAVHLRGFDVAPISAAGQAGERTLEPGDTLSLTLYWQADGPTDLDYTVFVHLVGPDGRPHGQADQFPGGGTAPTTSWAPGQVIVDRIALTADDDAPAGTYHVAVGMYDATSGGRLPITDRSGQSLPEDQYILPIDVTITGSTDD